MAREPPHDLVGRGDHFCSQGAEAVLETHLGLCSAVVSLQEVTLYTLESHFQCFAGSAAPWPQTPAPGLAGGLPAGAEATPPSQPQPLATQMPKGSSATTWPREDPAHMPTQKSTLPPLSAPAGLVTRDKSHSQEGRPQRV